MRNALFTVCSVGRKWAFGPNFVFEGLRLGRNFEVSVARLACQSRSKTWNWGSNWAFALCPRNTAKKLDLYGRSQGFRRLKVIYRILKIKFVLHFNAADVIVFMAVMGVCSHDRSICVNTVDQTLFWCCSHCDQPTQIMVIFLACWVFTRSQLLEILVDSKYSFHLTCEDGTDQEFRNVVSQPHPHTI